MSLFATIILGFAAGYLSGQFGLGGGLVATPGLRLLLATSPGIALGTTLPVVIPSAIAGSINYVLEDQVDWALAARLIPPGLAGVIVGALLTGYIDVDLLLLLTAVLIFVIGVSYILPHQRRQSSLRTVNHPVSAPLIGLIAGLFSGFLGVGGGFLLIPGMTRLMERPLKLAFGTSLVVISCFAVPGTLIHYALGHVDFRMAGLLVLGGVPGAYLGSKVALGLREQTLHTMFGVFLLLVSVYFGVYEVAALVKGA
ncbi:MAG: sulfite exporter TauE/SafE family protein [Candidatus Aquicultorales bacterium]